MDNGKSCYPVGCPGNIIEYRDGTHSPHTVICYIDQVIYPEMCQSKRVEENKVQECIQVRVPQTEITGNRKQGEIRSVR